MIRIFLFLVLLSSPVLAGPYVSSCDPLPPLAPFGCGDGHKICICSSNGDCTWVWICE